MPLTIGREKRAKELAKALQHIIESAQEALSAFNKKMASKTEAYRDRQAAQQHKS